MGITISSKDAGFAANGYIALQFKDMYGGAYTTKAIRLSANYYPMDSITNVNGDKCNNANNPCYDSSAGTHSATINPEHQYQLTGAGHSFFDADAIREALQALPNFAVPTVNVTEQIDVLEYTDSGTKYYYTSHSAADCGIAAGETPNGQFCGQSIFYVTFTNSGNAGRQNLMDCFVYSETESLGIAESNSRECAAAQPRLSTIDYSGVNHQISCTVEEVALPSGSSYEENSECSERGVCDHTTGVCACYEGHSGEDCSQQTIFF